MSVERRDDIKRQLKKRGVTLKDVEMRHELGPGHLSYHLPRPSVRRSVQAIINAELGYAYDWAAVL